MTEEICKGCARQKKRKVCLLYDPEVNPKHTKTNKKPLIICGMKEVVK